MTGLIRFRAGSWVARYGEDFDGTTVQLVGSQFAQQFARGDASPVLYVGYDSRREAAHYGQILAESAAAWGFDVRLSQGCCSLPALVTVCAQDPASAGSLMLTAGHEGAACNGIKASLSDGTRVPRDFAQAIELRSGLQDAPEAAPEGLPPGTVKAVNFTGPYLRGVASRVDLPAIQESGLHIVFDPLYGSCCGYAQALFDGTFQVQKPQASGQADALADALAEATHQPQEAGPQSLQATGPADPQATGPAALQLLEIHGQPREDFGGMSPNPHESWSAGCSQKVKETGAAAGFVLSADGTRLCAVDSTGRYVCIEKLAAILLEYLVRGRGLTGRVVMSTPASSYVRRQANRLGLAVTVVPVGSHWMAAEMAAGDVLMSVQETGGIAIPQYLRERDGLLAIALLCEQMAKTGATLAELVADLDKNVGHLEYRKRNLELDPGTTQMLRNVLPGVNPQSIAGKTPILVDHSDGLGMRFDDDAWLLIRPSNTSGAIRLYGEARTADEIEAMLEESCELVRNGFMT